MGVATQLSIYELDSVAEAIDQVPGLIGQDELAVWQGKMDFTDKSVEVFGQKGEIIPAASGHPCLSLLEFPDDGFLGEQLEHVDHQEPPDNPEDRSAFVEGLEIGDEFDQDDSLWEGSGTVIYGTGGPGGT